MSRVIAREQVGSLGSLPLKPLISFSLFKAAIGSLPETTAVFPGRLPRWPTWPRCPRCPRWPTFLLILFLTWIAFPLLKDRQTPKPYRAIFGREHMQMVFRPTQCTLGNPDRLRRMNDGFRRLRTIAQIVFEPAHGILPLPMLPGWL